MQESKRTAILATFAFLCVVGIMVADFLDNGKIGNGKFIIVSLFVFSGGITGFAFDKIVEKYIRSK